MFRLSLFLLLFLGLIDEIYSQSSIEFTEEEKQWIENHPIVTFGYEPNWPPFEIYAEGEYEGIIGEYVKIIEKETGIDMIPSTPMQWQESLEKFHAGQLKILTSISVKKNPDSIYAFTEPFIVDPLVIVTKKGYKEIEKLSDVEPGIIAVPKGFMRKNVLKDLPQAKPVYTNSVKESLDLVSQGKADLFVGSHKSVTYYVNEFSFKNLDYQPTPNGRFLKLCFGLNKDYIVFRNIIQKVFNNLNSYDKYRIEAKWVVLRHDQGINKEDVKKYLTIGIGVFLLAMLLFYLWNKTLRKQIDYRLAYEEQLKESLALINDKNTEKDILLKEIHHRVKNNLQIVYSMLNMQSRDIKNTEALKIVSEGKSRVMAMALIHKILYESDRLDRVNLESYIKSLLNNISKIYDSDKNIDLKLETSGIQLDLDKAIPVGLILNELLTNSFKHAFKGRGNGTIDVSFVNDKENIYFTYKDNGIGLKETDFESFNSLGMKLVKRLANQLQTEANLESIEGVKVWFNFKKD